jgi:hypothetical protein
VGQNRTPQSFFRIIGVSGYLDLYRTVAERCCEWQPGLRSCLYSNKSLGVGQPIYGHSGAVLRWHGRKTKSDAGRNEKVTTAPGDPNMRRKRTRLIWFRTAFALALFLKLLGLPMSDVNRSNRRVRLSQFDRPVTHIFPCTI